MAIKKTAAGKVDKRTKEYAQMCANLKKARKKQAAAKKAGSGTRKITRTASGKMDKRTKAYKDKCANLVKARKKKNSLGNRLKRFFGI